MRRKKKMRSSAIRHIEMQKKGNIYELDVARLNREIEERRDERRLRKDV